MVVALGLCHTLLACGGEVVVEGAQALDAAGCESCSGTASVEIHGLDWLTPGDPDLDIDLCVGVSCGQALLGIFTLPTGTYPDDCIADGDEVTCCSSSPVETMPECSAAPHDDVVVTVSLPLGVRPGDRLTVFGDVTTMQGEYVVALDGHLTVESCGEACVSGHAVLW